MLSYAVHTPLSLNTHIIFIAYVDVRDLDLQVFDDLSDKFLHKGVLLFQIWVLCQTDQHDTWDEGPAQWSKFNFPWVSFG